MPPEGSAGGFSRTWFPICTSADVGAGEVIGRDFLDGKVCVFRGASGVAAVVSAYCPHLGADLSLGCVVDDGLRCAFHHFRFDAAGTCVATGSGAPVPRDAIVFAFPTVEKHGMIWAFNGDEPAWTLPELAPAEEALVVRRYPVFTLRCDPWTVISNTTDYQHFRFVHGFELDFAATAESYEWRDNGVGVDLRARLPAHQGSHRVHYRIDHYGTNTSFIKGRIGEWNAYLLIAFGIPRVGESEIFTMLAAPLAGGDGDEALAAAEVALDQFEAAFGIMGGEDNPLLETAHFMPGALTATDRQLIRFLHYVRNYPRAHPSADFIV